MGFWGEGWRKKRVPSKEKEEEWGQGKESVSSGVFGRGNRGEKGNPAKKRRKSNRDKKGRVANRGGEEEREVRKKG